MHLYSISQSNAKALKDCKVLCSKSEFILSFLNKLNVYTIGKFGAEVKQTSYTCSINLNFQLIEKFSKNVSVQHLIEDEKLNNFKLIRLVAACFVIIAHSYKFINQKNNFLYDVTNSAIDLSYLGLAIFFFLSGLLIAQSLHASSSNKNFLWKRFLRLYPAAWLSILFCMFLLGPLVTVLSIKSYFSDPLFYKYAVGLSLIRINYFLPGVFINSPIKQIVNASLWSISLELKLYLCLLLFKSFNASFKKIIFMSFIVIALITGQFFYDATENWVKTFIPAFVLYPYIAYAPYFFIGALCYEYRKQLFTNSFIAFFSLILAFLSIRLNAFYLLRILIIPVLTLYAASLKSNLIKKITPQPDLSYGLYVFAFPVQQTISQLIGVANTTIWQMCLLSFICTLPFAIFSWNFIEKKALSFKNIIR